MVVRLVSQIMDAIDDGSARSVDYVNNFYSHVGDNNIGAIKNQATADPRVALAEMISMLSVLRVQVSAADRKIIDESLLSSAVGARPRKELCGSPSVRSPGSPRWPARRECP